MYTFTALSEIDYCIRFRLRSSSPLGSSSFSRSAVSVGFRICAMLPRRVGGVEMSRIERFLLSRLAEVQDQLFKLSRLLPTLPLENGGAGGLAGRESEYPDGASRIRWSSTGALLGEDGQCVEGGPEPRYGCGWLGCQPCARMSADVCRLARLLGGGSTARGG